MVPVAADPRGGRGARGGPHRPVRAHHAVARRDASTSRPRWSASGCRLPLLIGGATTSQDPYRGEDRAGLLRPGRPRPGRVARGGRRRRAGRPGAARRLRGGRSATEYEEVRRDRARPPVEGALPHDRRGARQPGADRLVDRRRRRDRRSSGVRTFESYPLAELVERIDWTPFFATWELRGRYPDILDDPKVGKAARDLFDDAQRLLERIVADERLLRRPASWASGRPTPTDDDIVAVARRDPDRASSPRFHTLRQQMAKTGGSAQRRAGRLRRAARPGCADYVGAFAVTAGHGLDGPDGMVAGSRRHNDDYSAILANGARRPARRGVRRAAARARPARAVGLRAPTRRSTTTPSSPSATRASARRPATRPARTTPRSGRSSSCWSAEERAGIRLTESMAMLPGASVSGYYFWHPASHYFGLGRIGARPARGLRAPQGLVDRRGRALAGPEPGETTRDDRRRPGAVP